MIIQIKRGNLVSLTKFRHSNTKLLFFEDLNEIKSIAKVYDINKKLFCIARLEIRDRIYDRQITYNVITINYDEKYYSVVYYFGSCLETNKFEIIA